MVSYGNGTDTIQLHCEVQKNDGVKAKGETVLVVRGTTGCSLKLCLLFCVCQKILIFFFNREVNVPFTCRKALYVTEKTIIKGGVLHFLTLHQDNLLLRTMMIPDVWIKYESETFG